MQAKAAQDPTGQPPTSVEEVKPKVKKDDKKISAKHLLHVDRYRRQLMNPDSEKDKIAPAGTMILDEKEHHIGDLALVFYNPDDPDFNFKDKAVNIEDAVHDFDAIINIDSVFSEVNLRNELLRAAFLQAFNRLPELSEAEMESFERVDHIKREQGKKKAIYITNKDGGLQKANIKSMKRFGNKGFMELNKETKEWQRTGRNVEEYATLLRMAIIIKLTDIGGFFIRQFLSTDGRYIYLILYAQDENLLNEAHRISLNVQVGICNCDLLSLEPIGSKYRPLRLSKFILKPLPETKNKKPDKVLVDLRHNLREMIKDINYPKLCKEIGLPPYEANQEIQDDEMEDKRVYQAYQYYLKIIQDGVKFTRKRFKDMSSLKTLTKTEIHEIMAQMVNPNSYKDKSNKPYVKEQVKLLFSPEGLNLKMVKAVNKRKMAQLYKELFCFALKESQKRYGSRIRTLWDIANLKPLSPFVDFFNPYHRQSTNKYLREQQVWERSIINTRRKHEIFQRMERQKLTFSMIEQLMNLEQLKDICCYIHNFFIPNSPFDLRGEKMNELVHDITHKAKLDPTILFSLQAKQPMKAITKKLQVIEILEQNALSPKKEANSNALTEWHRQKTLDYKLVMDNHKKNKKMLRVKGAKKKPQNVSEEDKWEQLLEKKEKIRGGLNGTNLKYVWGLFTLPIPQIRDYFGERIAIYFRFLGFYTKALFIIGLFAVPAFIASISVEQGSTVDQVSTIAFAILILFWSTVFNIQWQNAETKFAIVYGQEDVEDDETELISFKGKAMRSVATDKMNDLYEAEWWIWFRFILTLIFITLFMIIEVVGMYYLITWSLELQEREDIPDIDFIPLEVIIPTCVWMIMSLVMEEAFKPLAFKLSRWENHKYVSTCEYSYIAKVLYFSTLTRLGQPVIIAFVSTTLANCVYDNECFFQIQVYMRVAIFLGLFKSLIIQFVIPTLKFIGVKSRRVIKELNIKEDGLHRLSPFYKVNQVIEKESDRQAFSNREELDGTIDQMLDLVLQYGLIVNYGLPFPLVFVVAFATNIFQMKVDQLRLLEYCQKPKPLPANTIGLFNIYLELMSYLSIFVNSGLMTFTNTYIFEGNEPEILFLIFVFSFFGFKFVVDHTLEGGDTEINNIKLRHQIIRQRIQAGSRGKSGLISTPSYPIFKPFGTKLISSRLYKPEDPKVETNPEAKSQLAETEQSRASVVNKTSMHKEGSHTHKNGTHPIKEGTHPPSKQQTPHKAQNSQNFPSQPNEEPKNVKNVPNTPQIQKEAQGGPQIFSSQPSLPKEIPNLASKRNSQQNQQSIKPSSSLGQNALSPLIKQEEKPSHFQPIDSERQSINQKKILQPPQHPQRTNNNPPRIDSQHDDQTPLYKSVSNASKRGSQVQ